MGRNYLSIPEMPASGAKVLLSNVLAAITQVYQGQGPASLQVLTYSNGTYEVRCFIRISTLQIIMQ